MTTYPTADYIPRCDLAPLGVKRKPGTLLLTANVRAVKSREFRTPKKGEWYLSGAIVEAYRALNDLTTPFHIAELFAP